MKDHANFPQAAASLLKSRPDVHFVLSGQGVDRKTPALSGLVRDRGIAEREHLLGQRDDMPRLTAALDIASSSSAFVEGFPNVVGEAMSWGVPCVATDVGDSAWIVGDQRMVVSPSDPEALAARWQDVIDKASEAQKSSIGLNLRERVVHNFSLDHMIERTIKALRSDSAT